MNASLSRSGKKGGGNVGILPGNQFVITDHNLIGFSDPRPSQFCLYMSSLESLVAYLPSKQ